jgi:histidinol-phosphate aminotransferase
MSELIRSEIFSLDEYTLQRYPHRIKLNQNENPFELPQDIKAEILERLGAISWSRYPAFIPQRQIDAVAQYAGWVPDGTLLGNGSNDLLQLIFMSVLERNQTVVISQPTFTLYKILARGLAADVVEILMTPDFQFDVDGIIAAARRTEARLVVICSPNNPTGTLMPETDVVRIIEETEGLVVLDEAYVHFAPGSLCHLLMRYDRLIILQTFSKAMGAAGLRFGYALAPVDLAHQLNKIKLPYSVNIFTLVAAEVLLEHWNHLEGWIDTLIRERERVKAGLQKLPQCKVYPSSANFLLFESLRRKPAEVFDLLLKKGILIRNVSSYPMLGRGLRVSTGTPEENTAFLNAIREAL